MLKKTFLKNLSVFLKYMKKAALQKTNIINILRTLKLKVTK